MTTREGVEVHKLEPVSWNPVDLVLLKVFEMDRYIMSQNIIRDLKEHGLSKFVYARSQAPEGYVAVNDPAFTKYMPYDEEAYAKKKRDAQLEWESTLKPKKKEEITEPTIEF